MNWRTIGTISLLLLIASCGGEEAPPNSLQRGVPISQERYGNQWPLTIPSGRLSCVYFTGRRQIVTFIAPDGTEYSLNGNAAGSGYFLPIDSIHKPDPDNPPAKKSILVLIDEGLKLCPGV